MAVLVGCANKSGRAEKPWGDWGDSNLFFSRRRRSFSRASHANFSASPLVRPARQNCRATQAIVSSASCPSDYPEKASVGYERQWGPLDETVEYSITSYDTLNLLTAVNWPWCRGGVKIAIICDLGIYSMSLTCKTASITEKKTRNVWKLDEPRRFWNESSFLLP